jgi:hypothetical protein
MITVGPVNGAVVTVGRRAPVVVVVARVAEFALDEHALATSAVVATAAAIQRQRRR